MLKKFRLIKKIKTKLLVQFGTLMVLSAMFMVATVFSYNKLSKANDFHAEVSKLSETILALRLAEKNFLINEVSNPEFFKEKKSDFYDTFKNLVKEGNITLNTLKDRTQSMPAEFQEEVKNIENAFQNYTGNFELLYSLVYDRGFKDWGREGKLRKAIHEIEGAISRDEKVMMLTLRRHEKDYFLRKDLKYIQKFDNVVNEFEKELTAKGYATELITRLNNYSKNLKNIVEIEEQIGLSENDGIKGKLKADNASMFASIDILKEATDSIMANTRNEVILLISIIFAIQLGIGLWASLTFSNALSRSINTIKNRIGALSNGEFPEKIETIYRDEIGQASRALNNLIDRISAAVDFSTRIGKGELNSEYDENYNDDVLAASLLSMHSKLKDAAELTERRNWITSGLTEFGELLRQNNEDLEKVSRKLLAKMVKYVNLNQGQLYVVEEEADGEEFLQLVATYAWDRQKYTENKILKGEGLAGQAWIEQQTVFITDVPQDFVKISSGLGEACPSCISVIPLKNNDEVFGILEVAGFKVLESYEVEFLEKLAEMIASELAAIRNSTRTQKLLEESQRQAEDLKAQEEELRQNQEEMQATQEEMERQRKDLQQTIEELQGQLAEQE